jgi:Ni/Co efflux regulator RcnB
MKRLLLYLLLAMSAGIYAQQQDADEDQAASAAEQAAGDVPADRAEVPEDQEEPEQAGEADTDVPDEQDFNPEEEISEDYPVPLPSDI